MSHTQRDLTAKAVYGAPPPPTPPPVIQGGDVSQAEGKLVKNRLLVTKEGEIDLFCRKMHASFARAGKITSS